MPQRPALIEFLYRIHCDDGAEYELPVRLDARSLDLVYTPRENPPDWTRLEVGQCAGCPLDRDQHPRCPMALALVDLIEASRSLLSYAEVEARVTAPQRETRKRTSAQRVISSVLGLYMATAGCPVMAFLKPMARFHLPFATKAETVFRAVSAYLIAQYFHHQRGLPCDWELQRLKDAYARIQDVNLGMAERLRHVSDGDANINAIVILDLFAQELPFAIEEKLREIEYLFDPYFPPNRCNVSAETPPR